MNNFWWSVSGLRFEPGTQEIRNRSGTRSTSTIFESGISIVLHIHMHPNWQACTPFLNLYVE